jgi:glycopeptide antibiotics resistance protein
LWWVAGLSPFIFLIVAVPMAIALYRRRPIRTPPGFGLWLLFLAWMSAGVLVLWADAPGTVPGGSLLRLVNFSYRAGWYVAITIALLYVMNLSRRELSDRRISRLLGYMFVVTTVGGVAGITFPSVQITSLLEVILPGSIGSSGFVNTLISPELSSPSDFLGFVSPRPTAPFAYANAWGNNLSLFLPFFLQSWLGRDAGWRRLVAPPILLAAIVAVAFSLNRGVWLGLCVAAVFVAIRSAMAGHTMALKGFVAVAVLGAVLVTTPLYSLVALRLETPHSNERRAGVAETVLTTTWQGSPLLGYGTTRQVQGSFASIAGGETPDCHQCAAPPMGTQGFMWRLVFTTGFVGTALFMGFLLVQFAVHCRSRGRYALLGCTLIVMSLVFFLVYDSLESPLFTLMLAIGLMNRERLEDRQKLDPRLGPVAPGSVRG